EVSRSHKVIAHPSGMVTLTGGKWTSYRKMAEDAVDKAIEVHNLNREKCKSYDLSIHGNMDKKDVDRSNHLYVYGADIPAIKKLEAEKVEYAEKLHPKYDYTVAEVVWGVREEMAMNLEDILARRVRLLFLDARVAIECAPKVAAIMAQELGKDKAWEEAEVNGFVSLAKNYLLE
ncbi:MAG: FAD-dependent oxidoreductase, partial [Bacteroidales bacterium]|nr:FAD-dependent oxidoreductase [Bacteroidales bacterium]